jgi:hypothetical protein
MTKAAPATVGETLFAFDYDERKRELGVHGGSRNEAVGGADGQ